MIVCCLMARPAFPQDRVAQLLEERDRLYQQYDQNLAQRNALFGGKSKKDLGETIRTLEGIIAKDNELIREVRLLSVQRQSAVIGQNQATISRLYELEQEVSRLKTRVGATTAQLKTRQADKAALQANVAELRRMVVGLSAVVAGLLGYTAWLRRKARHRESSAPNICLPAIYRPGCYRPNGTARTREKLP